MTTADVMMRRALALAERGRYSVSPNPMVGCIIERDGEVIGEGYHQRAGEPHAEVNALTSCTTSPEGATVWVTLEPCSHHGRTAPCADALIAARVGKVIIAAEDPNPLVAGEGIRRLIAAGIEVQAGVLAAEAARLNETFFYSISRRRPFVVLKGGMSLDGRLATSSRESKWITGAAARERSLRLREEYDAILVGSGTVRTDDPQLTRRLALNRSIQPWTRVILDGTGDIPPGARVLSDGGRTILFTAAPDRYQPSEGLEIIPVMCSGGRLDLGLVLGELGSRSIRSLLVEGGSEVHGSFIRESLFQKMVLFVAPMLIGGASAPSLFGGEGFTALRDAARLRFDSVETLGDDLMITAYPLT